MSRKGGKEVKACQRKCNLRKKREKVRVCQWKHGLRSNLAGSAAEMLGVFQQGLLQHPLLTLKGFTNSLPNFALVALPFNFPLFPVSNLSSGLISGFCSPCSVHISAGYNRDNESSKIMCFPGRWFIVKSYSFKMNAHQFNV